MLDPFPLPPPPWLLRTIKPFADALNLHTLPLHAHEVLFAAALYTFTSKILSPLFSTYFFPRLYPTLSRRGKKNWDVHIVSFVQALVINGISLWIIWFDEERKGWRREHAGVIGGEAAGLVGAADPEMRIWGYYGFGGLCQSFALGYFLWDLVMCSLNIEIFGVGMLAHATSAVAVFGLGYRPYIYHSAPIFLLYELSSPFLNIHWFCDKLSLTGSTLQAVNGVFLVATFFGCRLVWGIWNSILVFSDMYAIVMAGHTDFKKMVPRGKIMTYSAEELLRLSKDPIAQLDAFNRERYIPLWIPLIYLASNLILNSLNIFWFGKMIETIRTRFPPPYGTLGLSDGKVHYQPQLKDSDENSSSDSDSVDSDLGVGAPGKDKHEYHRRESMSTGKGKVKKARSGGDTRVKRTEKRDGGVGVEVSGSATTRKSGRRRKA